eukprot:564409-Rhodomonas_salina.1
MVVVSRQSVGHVTMVAVSESESVHRVRNLGLEPAETLWHDALVYLEPDTSQQVLGERGGMLRQQQQQQQWQQDK